MRRSLLAEASDSLSVKCYSVEVGLDSDSMGEALTFDPRLRKPKSRGRRKKKQKDSNNCQTAIAFQSGTHRCIRCLPAKKYGGREIALEGAEEDDGG